ncbi:uncharacterized protein LOC116189876 [Punica granatum]|uniref:Uncharacterized protein LOC116189876 n=1 Tax=Punica granatum TaxID=22663 RepID=A0A218XEG3_PUNGR|nr:uncharacterized protein LOC116189876 [Punica granatum]OWM83106.1 hypothetical protein CDL15_Pgr011788 [Punica granatum]
MAALWELPVIRSSTDCRLLDHCVTTTNPSDDTTLTSSSSEWELFGSFDFYVTRKRRFVVQDHCGDEIDVQEFYDGQPRFHQLPGLPVSLIRIPHVLESFLCCHLADLGVDPVSRQRIAGAILSDVNDAVVQGHMRKFLASADLEITAIEVVRAEPDDDNGWVQALPYEGPRGASSAAIMKLNAASFVYGEKAGDTITGTTCVVCLEELSGGGPECNRRRLTEMPCRHVFHNSCIVRWLETNRACPLCRQELDD